ncbi:MULTISPECIES: NUDIX hydrolase [unclassified Clostridium]|uniref:NUDIX hydrolase n=1 Tax=unclassified Clostridium TaxID=2614128 RepID=UPI0025BB7CA3|nr:NUDIX hydrolase [Clostridium sp.]MCI6691334.1 NUDIX hydrolase [Clostridium sp.]MDY2631768.1 NUDIX hydrolase [Clostridium sp.]MDY4253145.1 NUDIX hydrolase [Clostridium sp.]MDY6227494.1 NUDIX hydrolase [Clostridium sp.]
MSKVKNIKTLSKTKYLSLYSADYTNKKGNLKNWIIASRKSLEDIENKFFNNEEDKIDAVVIIAKHVDEDKLVVIRQFRVPINDYVIELPAGLVDGSESFEEAVRRELKEETGLDLIEIDREATKEKVYISVGMTDESIALVKCTCNGVVSQENLEEDEDIEVVMLNKEEAKELINSNENIDVKALLVIQNFILSDN